jgi:CRISPR/Cas system-associated exonuclease Cas4 (RecB family)
LTISNIEKDPEENQQNYGDQIQTSTDRITGTKIAYYFLCKRKLWLFSHNITFEQESEDVKIGK